MTNIVNFNNKKYKFLNFRINFYKKYLLLNYLKNKKIFFKNYLNNNKKNINHFKLQKNKTLNINFFKNNLKQRISFNSKTNNLNLHRILKKFNELFLYIIKLKKRKFNLFFTSAIQLRKLKKNSFSRFAILKINNYITNYNFLFTTLQGKVLFWSNGGSLKDETKRTRMTPRAFRSAYKLFLKKIIEANKKRPYAFKYLKIQFIGPSKRFRYIIKRMTKVRQDRLKLRLFCIEEQYIDTFNGCRLARKKR
jgi:ribosomal protein S11